MKVILIENIAKVGKKYDIKKVAAGFGRNFLIPRGLAKMATTNEVARIEAERAQFEAKIKKRHEETLVKLEKAKKAKITVKASANEEGHLYAGLKAEDIASILKSEQGIEIETDWIVLDKPIKSAGEFEIKIKKNPFSTDKELKDEFIEIPLIVEAE